MLDLLVHGCITRMIIVLSGYWWEMWPVNQWNWTRNLHPWCHMMTFPHCQINARLYSFPLPVPSQCTYTEIWTYIYTYTNSLMLTNIWAVLSWYCSIKKQKKNNKTSATKNIPFMLHNLTVSSILNSTNLGMVTVIIRFRVRSRQKVTPTVSTSLRFEETGGVREAHWPVDEPWTVNWQC